MREQIDELEQELHFCQVTKLSMDSVEKYTDDLKKQNKRYREAREIIEQVYKENYVRNANTYGYEDGYLDGLDTAIGIIDKALEDEE